MRRTTARRNANYFVIVNLRVAAVCDDAPELTDVRIPRLVMDVVVANDVVIW